MAIVFTGSKTVTVDVSPTVTAAILTAILATAPELWTVAQLNQVNDARKHVPGGKDPTSVLGALFK